jgi:hypothetical protein
MFKLNNQHPKPRLTAEEYELRIWGFVVIIVMLVFAGITASMLYSVIFVVQPIKSMAPIDQAFTKMLNDIVLLIVGGIGGIMAKKGVGAVSEAMAGPSAPVVAAPVVTPPAPNGTTYTIAPQASAMPNFNWMGYTNPALDETWTPGPPPTTPPEHQEPDHEREALAVARSEVF